MVAGTRRWKKRKERADVDVEAAVGPKSMGMSFEDREGWGDKLLPFCCCCC